MFLESENVELLQLLSQVREVEAAEEADQFERARTAPANGIYSASTTATPPFSSSICGNAVVAAMTDNGSSALRTTGRLLSTPVNSSDGGIIGHQNADSMYDCLHPSKALFTPFSNRNLTNGSGGAAATATDVSALPSTSTATAPIVGSGKADIIALLAENSITSHDLSRNSGVGAYTLSYTRMISPRTSPVDADRHGGGSVAGVVNPEEELPSSLLLSAQKHSATPPHHTDLFSAFATPHTTTHPSLQSRHSPLYTDAYNLSTPPTVCKSGVGHQAHIHAHHHHQHRADVPAVFLPHCGATTEVSIRAAATPNNVLTPMATPQMQAEGASMVGAATPFAPTPSRQVIFHTSTHNHNSPQSPPLSATRPLPHAATLNEGFSIPSPPRPLRSSLSANSVSDLGQGISVAPHTLFSMQQLHHRHHQHHHHHRPQRASPAFTMPESMRSPVSLSISCDAANREDGPTATQHVSVQHHRQSHDSLSSITKMAMTTATTTGGPHRSSGAMNQRPTATTTAADSHAHMPSRPQLSPLGPITAASVLALLTAAPEDGEPAVTGGATGDGPTLRRLSPCAVLFSHADTTAATGIIQSNSNNKRNILSLKLLALCRDQHGCRILQGILERESGFAEMGSNTTTAQLRETQRSARYAERFASSLPIQRIMAALQPELAYVMSDAYGNFLVQKIFEVAPDVVRRRLLMNSSLNECLCDVACSAHGTFAVQRLMETIRDETEEVLVFGALQRKLIDLLTDVNGGHVLYKMLAYIKHYYQVPGGGSVASSRGAGSAQPWRSSAHASTTPGSTHSLAVLHEKVAFLYNGIVEHLLTVCKHKHGCCVVQKCLDFFSKIPPISPGDVGSDGSATLVAKGDLFTGLVENLLNHVVTLSVDPYGNYVVTHVVEVCYAKGCVELVDAMALRMQEHLLTLCTDKFASNVVEHVLRYCNDRRIREVCHVLMSKKCSPPSVSFFPAAAAAAAAVAPSSSSSPPHPQLLHPAVATPRSSGAEGPALLQVAADPYGNYVVQTLLTVAPVDELLTRCGGGGADSSSHVGGMLPLLQAHLPLLREQHFGKKIETKMDLAQQRVAQSLLPH